MRTRFTFIVGVLMVLGLSLPAAMMAEEADGSTQRFIVGFHELPTDRARYQGEPIVDTDEDLSFLVIETSNPNSFERRVKQDNRALYIEEDHSDWHLTFVPNDPLYTEPGHYGTAVTNAEAGWDVTTGATSVIVAMIDSGISAGHEDLEPSRLLQGWDYVNGDDTPEDSAYCSWHGSHTTGTAGATIDNGAGIAGISQHTILPLKIFHGKNPGPWGCSAATTSDIAQAIKDAADAGAHVSSNSWGGGGSSTTLDNAIDYAHTKGTIHVAAAGNDGSCTDCVNTPWRDNPAKTVIVSCSDSSDTFCSFSSQGSQVDLIAPGYKILSLTGSSYQELSGTSMSTPHVTGAVALYTAAHGDVSFSTVEAALKTSADDIGLSADRQGAGRLNIGALLGATGTTNSPPTASFTYSCTDLACDFDGTGSSDSDGTISSYAWDFGDGNTATGSTVSHTYASGGTYTVTLTVTDDAGATGTDSQDVSVSDGTNSPPTAEFTYSCTDLACDFDGSSSSDSDGSISSYAWDFGDGNTATGSTVSHTYTSGGDYTVTLTVTDDDGATDSSSQTVSVTGSSSGSDTMHVHAIDQYLKGPHLWIDVFIYDSSESAVSDATVSVEVCDSSKTCATGTATTDSAGMAQFRWHKAGSGTYTACVTSLTHSTLTWDTAADHAGSGSCATATV